MAPFIFSVPLPAVLFWLAFCASFASQWLAWRDRRAGHVAANEDRGTFRIASAGLGLGITLGFAAAWWEPSRIPGGGWTPLAAGLALMCSGTVLRAWAIWALGPFWHWRVVVQDDHRVVTTGPYRYIRHPAYAGGLLAALGLGLALGSWASIAACIVLPLAGLLPRIRVEEAALTTALGEPYREYVRRTWRLLPGVW